MDPFNFIVYFANGWFASNIHHRTSTNRPTDCSGQMVQKVNITFMIAVWLGQQRSIVCKLFWLSISDCCSVTTGSLSSFNGCLMLYYPTFINLFIILNKYCTCCPQGHCEISQLGQSVSCWQEEGRCGLVDADRESQQFTRNTRGSHWARPALTAASQHDTLTSSCQCTLHPLHAFWACTSFSTLCNLFPVLKLLHSVQSVSHQRSPFVFCRSQHSWHFLGIFLNWEGRRKLTSHVFVTEYSVLYNLSIYADTGTDRVVCLSSDLRHERSECAEGQWPAPDGKLHETSKENSLTAGELKCFNF